MLLDMTADPPEEKLRFTGVGDKAHGCVLWRNVLVMLDSDNGALVTLDPKESDILTIWTVRA